MTEGTIVAAEKTTAGSAPRGAEHPTWNGATAARALEESVRDGLLKPCRALILGADMVEEAATLAKLGFEVLVTDTSAEALARAGQAVRAQGGKIAAVRADFFQVRQYFYGPVELIVERTLLPNLEPVRRADWSYTVLRCLPKDGHLFGLFRVGRGASGPPYSMSADEVKKMLSRLLVLEAFAQVGNTGPGRDQAWKGVFRKK